MLYRKPKIFKERFFKEQFGIFYENGELYKKVFEGINQENSLFVPVFASSYGNSKNKNKLVFKTPSDIVINEKNNKSTKVFLDTNLFGPVLINNQNFSSYIHKNLNEYHSLFWKKFWGNKGNYSCFTTNINLSEAIKNNKNFFEDLNTYFNYNLSYPKITVYMLNKRALSVLLSLNYELLKENSRGWGAGEVIGMALAYYFSSRFGVKVIVLSDDKHVKEIYKRYNNNKKFNYTHFNRFNNNYNNFKNKNKKVGGVFPYTTYKFLKEQGLLDDLNFLNKQNTQYAQQTRTI